MVRAATVERWRQRVSAYDASGLTQGEWSRRNGVSRSALKLWIRRLRTSLALVPIVVGDSGPTAGGDALDSTDRSTSGRRGAVDGGAVEVAIGAVRIRADSAVDPTWLATLLKQLA